MSHGLSGGKGDAGAHSHDPDAEGIVYACMTVDSARQQFQYAQRELEKAAEATIISCAQYAGICGIGARPEDARLLLQSMGEDRGAALRRSSSLPPEIQCLEQQARLPGTSGDCATSALRLSFIKDDARDALQDLRRQLQAAARADDPVLWSFGALVTMAFLMWSWRALASRRREHLHQIRLWHAVEACADVKRAVETALGEALPAPAAYDAWPGRRSRAAARCLLAAAVACAVALGGPWLLREARERREQERTCSAADSWGLVLVNVWLYAIVTFSLAVVAFAEPQWLPLLRQSVAPAAATASDPVSEAVVQSPSLGWPAAGPTAQGYEPVSGTEGARHAS
ncbi:hypothetical protein JKP88DRAFT_322608 [Tribonema minus]|uniref:Uncharacterized protein n=1 Tax=Tribonema minus TaxID=303371 RepID=A0A835YTV6_9STRA|nr:hypothetical protein JKP88DRAFT_322608 [Tribonema minus]